MIIASICMRGGSKGVKGKNYKDLLGKPLLEHTIECAKAAKLLDDIVISSDDELILNLSEKHLPEHNLYKRDSNLATDSASKWDVFKDLVLSYEKKNYVQIKYLVDLDVTVPLRLPKHIDGCIEFLKEKDFNRL